MGRRLTAIGLILILVSVLLFSCNSVEPIQETKETDTNSKSSIEPEISSTVNTTTQENTQNASIEQNGIGTPSDSNQDDNTQIEDVTNEEAIEGDKDIDVDQNNVSSIVESNESNNQKDNPQITNTLIDDNPITEEDFNIYYKGILINDKIPFEEIAEKLGINIGEYGSNIENRARGSIGGVDFSWYIVHYPSKENEDMEIEYAINETTNTVTLVSIDLFTVKTYRDIAVGDSIDKFLEAYGKAHSNYTFYELKLSKELLDKEIYFVVDDNLEKITEISINYNQNRMMDELNITAFD